MTRIPSFLPAELDDAQLEVYRDLTAPARGGRPHAHPLADSDGALTGPCNAWMLNPGVGHGLERMGAAILTHLTLTPRCKEIAILAVARHARSGFEEYAHRLAASSAGMTDDEIAVVCDGGPAGGLVDPVERAVLETARALLEQETLDDEAYAAAREALGETSLFDLTVLIGHYRAIALQLAVFDVRAPRGAA